MSYSKPEIAGDILVDRLVGWMTLGLTVTVIGLGLVIPHEGRVSTLSDAFAHYRLLILTGAGAIALTRSSRIGYWVAVAAFGIRLAIDTMELGVHHSDRFISMAWAFDLAMLGYAVLRLRAIARSR